MTIDIIDLNDPDYADLSAVQLSMVRVAQGKKNEILAAAQREKDELRDQLIANHFARSSVMEYAEDRIDEEAQEQIAVVKEDLLYQLSYEALASEGNAQGPYRYPENPNYNLTPSQRFLVVRNYYMMVTDDPDARLQAYAMDTLAMSYLGEFYSTLYDLLASYC